MKMAGPLHPPFSLFLPEEKEKTGRARSKREKEVTGDAAGARLNERRSRNDFPRAIRLSGGLSRDEWTSSSFRCRTPVVAPELRLPAFEEPHSKTEEGLPLKKR